MIDECKISAIVFSVKLFISFLPGRPVDVDVVVVTGTVGCGDGKSQHSRSGNSLDNTQPRMASSQTNAQTPHIPSAISGP